MPYDVLSVADNELDGDDLDELIRFEVRELMLGMWFGQVC